tara:strand:- start:223 stop:459 length:237 start_codon:yes stop_codon:yes gene_type:complete
MRLNQAFRRSIKQYLRGKKAEELESVSEEPFLFTLEKMEGIERALLSRDRDAKAKEEKKAKRAKKKEQSEEMSDDGDA